MQISAALTASQGAELVLTPLDLEEPRAGEVLVRIGGAGVCHTSRRSRREIMSC